MPEATRMLDRVHYWLTRVANPALFVVTIADGQASRTSGEVPLAWVDDCTTIAEDFGIVRGRVEAARGVHGIELRFSPDIPAASHQRFRNTFAVYRLGRR